MVLTALSLTLYATPSQADYPLEFLQEAKCLATNIYFEARGEPIKGQIAVAMVTINRVKDGRFADTICDVVYQSKTDSNGDPILNRCQFSWYCDNISDKVPPESPEARLAMIIAIQMLSNPVDDFTSGALYFHTKNKPIYSENFIEIGNHVFFRRG
jgi:spore germination cell wall hydrolase CwlJ-like protein